MASQKLVKGLNDEHTFEGEHTHVLQQYTSSPILMWHVITIPSVIKDKRAKLFSF